MAAFNPSPGGVPAANMPDQTGASRGAIPNRAFESLFEGAGALVKGAVTAYDDLNKYNITEEVKAGWGKANEPFDTDNLPKDLTDSVATLKSLQTARDQGKLSDVYYTGQLAAMTKSLRAKYPHYDEFIDQTVQGITGIRPANAFRNAILNEFEQQAQDASDKEKADAKWIEDNAGYIYQVNSSFFDDPSRYDLELVKREVNRFKGQEAARQTEMDDFEYALKADQVTDELTIETASTTLRQITDTKLNNIQNGLNVKGSNFLEQITNMAADGYSPEEAQQLGIVLAQMEAQLTTELDAAMNQEFENDPNHRSFNDMLDPTKTKQLRDRALEPFLNLKKFAYDENWGMFAAALNKVKVMKDVEVKRIMENIPEAVTGMALKEISPALGDLYLQEPGRKETIFAQANPELMAGVAMGSRSWADVVTDMAKSRKDAATKADGINGMIDLAEATITGGQASDEEFANAVKSIYGKDELKRSVFSYIVSDEYAPVFAKMYNPKITEAIVASGDKELISTYYQGAIDIFTAIPSFTRAVASINKDASLKEQGFNSVQFEFNPDFNRFIVKYDLEAMNEGPFANMDLQDKQDWIDTKMITIQPAVDDLNRGLAILDPILDGVGLSDEEKTSKVKKLIEDLNTNLENGNFGLFDTLAKSMGNTTEDAGTEPPKVTIPEDFSFNMTDTQTDTGSYFDKVVGVESSGDPNSQSKTSSASGHFGITEGTFNYYSAKLGLSGDKNDPATQRAIAEAYTADSDAALKANGIPINNETRYALHFLGQGDGPDVLLAPDRALVSDYIGPKSLKANPFLVGMTVLEFKAWVAGKMR